MCFCWRDAGHPGGLPAPGISVRVENGRSGVPDGKASAGAAGVAAFSAKLSARQSGKFSDLTALPLPQKGGGFPHRLI
ncbi:MAG: hypothetical protein R2941_04485 [Desulfobacterales bacterium]